MAGASEAARRAGAAAERGASSPALRFAARGGYVVAGVLHLVIAGIALGVAFGGGGSADPSGALGAIAATPFGAVLVWVCAIGLFLLALVQLLNGTLTLMREGKEGAKDGAKAIGTGLAYGAIGVTAVQVAAGSGANSEGTTESFTAKLLAAPGGAVLVALVGVGILAIGVYFVVSGVTRRFEQQLTDLGSTTGRWTVRAGRIGYPAKGAVLAIVGVLFVVAAFTHDPQNAAGLDGALKALRDQPFGQVLLVVVALGLAVYGVFLFGRAKHQKL
ncbi:MAG TPA: DUF1206 domain-containing protein [Rhodoglobus sp.]|nr:DUF1206 domain-containing protein [Rhodoglobus sp.]